MEKQNYTIREHYVPQFYLKNFSISTHSKEVYSIRVSAPNTKPKKMSIDSICWRKDLYESHIGAAYYRRNDTEDAFSKCECLADKLVCQIISMTEHKANFNNALILSSEEKTQLFKFITHLFLRNEGIYNYYYHKGLQVLSPSFSTDWDIYMRAFLKPCVNSLLFDPNSICNSSCKNHTPFYQFYSHLNRMNFEFLFSHDSFITSSFLFGINYTHNSNDDFELWVPLGSHVGVCFTSRSVKSRNRLYDITNRTTEINSGVVQ